MPERVTLWKVDYRDPPVLVSVSAHLCPKVFRFIDDPSDGGRGSFFGLYRQVYRNELDSLGIGRTPREAWLLFIKVQKDSIRRHAQLQVSAELQFLDMIAKALDSERVDHA